MDCILISIVIPVYKVEQYIVECLESVLKQTYTNLEIVVVDDCSPDQSMQVALPVIKQLRERFSVVVCEHEVNSGLSVARNTGINNSNGLYVFFLDSDDVLFPHSISSLVSAIRNNEDIVMGNYIKSTSKSAERICEKNYEDNRSVFLSFITNKWNVMACNKLIRLGFLKEKKIQFEPGLLHEDELFSFNTSLRAQSMVVVNSVTYWYRMREGAITHQHSEKNVESLIEIIKMELSLFYGRNVLKEESSYFSGFIVQRCYIALTMAFLNNLPTKKNLASKLQSLLESHNEKSNRRFSVQFKKRLLQAPVWIIEIYMMFLKVLKNRGIK